jgi:hypothetical protein
MTNRFLGFLIAAVFMLSGSALAGNRQVVEEIPTLSEWGLLVMGIGLLSLGVRFLRRRGLASS